MNSHILKYGDLIIIQGTLSVPQGSKRDAQSNQGPECSGFLSALAYTDNRVFLQAVPKGTTEHLKVAANWNNYRELIFQIWPKVSYEAHKQLKKLKRERAGLLNDDAKALLDEKIKKMKNRAEEEKDENMKMIDQFLGHSVTYGTEMQLMHLNSESFLSSRVACSDSDKSAYKFELINEFNSGMSFVFKPKFKIRQEGDPVQLKDQVLIYSMKMKCYVNFANDKPIELDDKLEIPSNLTGITAPFEHRQISQGTKRFEAFVSQTKDCIWELHRYGDRLLPGDNRMRGGDLVKLKYTESDSYLAADVAQVSKSPEVIGQEYKDDYEYQEELNNINTIWEVEIEADRERGAYCTVTEAASNPQPIRLRHLLTGKLLGVETVSGGALGLDDSRPKSLLVALNYEANGQQKKPTVIFKPFASNTSGDLTYDSAYGIGVSDETGNYKFIKSLKSEDVSSKKADDKQKRNVSSIYKPLDENESPVNKSYMICEHNEANPEHAFMPIKITWEEEKQINFVATSICTLKYFRDLIKASKTDDINPLAIAKTLSVLQDLIFFVHKTEDNDEAEQDPVEYEGIVVEEKQRLLKNFRVIELLTEILYYPFQLGITDLETIGQNESLCKVFQYCYRLIKHVIKEYRPNEIYASQWLELYMDQAMRSNKENDIKAGATLIELIDNNEKILDDRINTEMIEKFVIMLKENKSKKYVKLLRALCVCDGKPVETNQQDMSNFIIGDVETRNHLIYQNFRIQNGKITIRVDEDAEFTLDEFRNSERYKDQYKYFISMIYLLADLCLGRNYIAIGFLQQVYTYELCFQIVTEELPKDHAKEQAKDNVKDTSHASHFKIKSAFARLLNNLWVDTKPYQPLNVPQYLILWDEINPINCRQIACTETDASKFNNLKDHLKKYFDALSKEGCTRIYKVDKNKFTCIILEIANKLVTFGFYTDVEQIKALLRPLLVILNGMQDVTTPNEYEVFKRKLKSTKKAKKTIYLGTGDLEETNNQRYEEGRDTTIVMDCKNRICELIKVILDIDDDLRLRQYLLEFKNELGSMKGKDNDFSELGKSPDKKSLFGNYQKLFRANDGPVDFVQNSLEWIRNIKERNPIDLMALAPANFGRMLFDLCLYQHEDLVNNSFGLLNNIHSQRMRLKDMLENVHILEEPEKKRAVLTIEENINELRELAESSELWYDKKNSANIDSAKKCIQLVKKLSSFLINDSLLFRGQNAEPDAEIITTKPNANHSPDGFEDEDGFEEEGQGVDSEFQTILRHLKVHEPLLVILEYETQRPPDQSSETRIAVIREVCKLLAKFACGAKVNQNLLMNDMEVLLEIMTRYSSSGVDELIEVLFKNNRSLIRQVEEIKKFTKTFLQTISKLKITHPRSSKMIMSLEPFMKYNKVPIKVNQTAILALLTHREFSNIFIALDTKKTSREDILKDDIFKKVEAFNNSLKSSNGLIELPPEVDYLSSLLEILSCTCDGKNAVTESRSQNVWPLRQLLVLYEKAEHCWILKRSILLFVFHVYMETERGMREGDDLHKLIFEKMIEDMKYVVENPISRYEIRYHKGSLDNKQAQELFYFDAILPCISKSLDGRLRFFGKEQQHSENLRTMFSYLLEMKQLALSRSQKQELNKTISQFRIHAQEIYREGFEKAKLDNLEIGDLSRDMSKRMSISGSSMNMKEEATKDSKLKMRLSMLGEREEFQEYAENEFESMIGILTEIEKPEDNNVFSSSISFDKVIKNLIELVTNTKDQELMFAGLKAFRKIVERENKDDNNPAADWDGEEWTKYEKKIGQKQNQLCDLGIINMICKIISDNEENFELQQECILVGIAMLLGGNKKVQEKFLDYIQNDATNEFMFKIRLLIEKNFSIVKKEMSLKNKFFTERLEEKENNAVYKKAAVNPGKLTSPKGSSLEMGASGEFDDDNDDLQVETQAPDGEEAEQSLSILTRTYRFLQLFCEGHFKAMQDQLREQTDKDGNVNGKSQDFISRTAYYFNTLIKQINVDSLDFGVQMLDFLIEAMQGPCEKNQKALAKAKIINSCMDFLTTFKQTRDYHKQGFLDEKDHLRVNDATTTAIKLLNTLIEGSDDKDIKEEMGTLDFKFLIYKLSEEYKTFVNDTLKLNVETVSPSDVTAKLNADSFNKQILESFDVYILMANLADSNPKVDSLLKKTEEYTDLEKDALVFFKTNLADIEIKFNDKLLKIYFPKYPICQHLSRDSRKDLMTNVNRDSGNEKVMGLVNAADGLFDEMSHMAFLKEQIFWFNQRRYNILRDLSTLLSLLINIVILSVYYYSVQEGDSIRKIENMGDLSSEQTINVLGYLQIGTSSLMIVFWIIINGPIILKRKWRDFNKENKSDDENQDLLSFLEDEPNPEEVSLYHALVLLERKGPYDPIFNPDDKRKYGHLFVRLVCYWRNIVFIMTEGKFIFMVFYLIISILGVAVSEITYCFHLLDVINRFDTLRNVVKSVTHNLNQLLLTSLLGLILIYIYALFGFFFIDEMYYNGDVNDVGERSCTSMFHCYMTTLNYGLRNGGGIGESLTFLSYEVADRIPYFFRLVFDLSFFIIINVVFLNIIFGIIIDTFAELRDKKKEMDEDMKNRCFICHIERSEFDKNGTGFEKHIEKRHHLWNYLFYIYSVKAKDSTEYNGIESYVQEKLENEDASWFPLNEAIELQEDTKE